MRLRQDERGLTLTELLVTIVVLGVIMVPLGNVVIGFIRLTDDTTQRLNESHDVQLLTAYFAQDVQNLGTRDWASPTYPPRQSVVLDAQPTDLPYPCGPLDTPVAAVRLAWDDPQSATGAPLLVRVSYVVVVVGEERQLRRLTCIGSDTVASDIVVAHNLDPTPPEVVCSTTCASPAVPVTVTMTLKIKDPSNSGPALTVTVSGTRRQT